MSAFSNDAAESAAHELKRSARRRTVNVFSGHVGRAYQSVDILTAATSVGYSDTVKHWRLLMVAETEAKMTASSASPPRWLVLLRLGARLLL